MARVLWEIRRTVGAVVETRTAAAWGVSGTSLEFGTQEADKLSFTADQAFDDPDLFPFGCSVDLLRDGVRVFAGRIVRAPRRGEIAGESVSYEAAGPWWWLDHYVFEQFWRMPNGFDPTGGLILAESPLTRVLLGKDIDNLKMPAGAVIREVFTFLTARVNAPILLGDVELDEAQIPAEEARDITCAEVIKRVLRWSPDVYPVWDLTTAKPTLHFRRLVSTPAVAFAAGDTEGVPNLTPRYDLRPSCVVIRFVRNNTFNNGSSDETLPEIILRKWPADGNIYAPDALPMTVQLEGSSTTEVRQRVTTAGIDVSSLTWWKKKIPALKDAKLTGTTVDLNTATLVAAGTDDVDPTVPEGTVYGNELLDGALAPWMGKKAAAGVASVLAAVRVQDPDTGEWTTRKDLLKVSLRTTNAGTGEYATVTDSRPAEPIPEGLAQRYFEALATLQYDGEIRLHDEEWDGRNRVGTPLNLKGFAQAAWATMGAGCYRQSVSLDTGTVSLSIGPAKHLGVDDWVQLCRPQRGRTFDTGKIGTQRKTGRLSGDKPLETSRNLPKSDTTSTTLTAPAAKLDWTITPLGPGDFRVRTGHINGTASTTDPQFNAGAKTWVYAEATFAASSGPEISGPGYGVVINVTTNEADLKKQSERVRRILLGIVTPGTSGANCTVEQVHLGAIYISRPKEIDDFEVRTTGSGSVLGWWCDSGLVLGTYNDTGTHIERTVDAQGEALPADGTTRIGVKVDISYTYDTSPGVADWDNVRITSADVSATLVTGAPDAPVWSNYDTGPSFDATVGDSSAITDGCCGTPTTVAGGGGPGPASVQFLSPGEFAEAAADGTLIFPLATITTAGGVITAMKRHHTGAIELDLRPALRFLQIQHTS